MLGKYVRSQKVRIPARFQNNEKHPVPVENVVLKIEHFDADEKRIIEDLSETSMRQMSPSDYLYEYEIPQSAKNATYLIHITAKIPQNNYKVFEALEQFEVVSSLIIPENKEKENEIGINELDGFIPPKINYESLSNTSTSEEKILEDIVVDVENNPIKGVHVNAYLKGDFKPNDNSNVKIGSTMTDNFGKWTLKLEKGEYVIVFRGIGLKENREFRKV